MLFPEPAPAGKPLWVETRPEVPDRRRPRSAAANRGRPPRAYLRRGAAALVAGALLLFAPQSVGCAGARTPAAKGSAAEVDVEHEMDVLYGCAWQVWLEDDLEIASRDAERRQLISAWESEDTPRMRWYASVILHPTYGPGLTVQRQTHVWRGHSDQPDPEWSGVVRPLRDAPSHAPGWFVHPRTPEAIGEEEAMSRRIQACWQERR